MLLVLTSPIHEKLHFTHVNTQVPNEESSGIPKQRATLAHRLGSCGCRTHRQGARTKYVGVFCQVRGKNRKLTKPQVPVQVVSRRPFTAEAQVRSQASPREIYGVECGTGKEFFPQFFGFPLSVSFYQCSVPNLNLVLFLPVE
jgi:hypothetical protein